ncbi:hypothetical protein [Streptomyces sp. NPDC052225]|uniref:hypothetical protein n=1 Tax=Streptomyces sp. NPDC052225 TaxID=3154949 RepID=UPI0034283480
MTHPYTPAPPTPPAGPGIRRAPKWARKRIVIPAVGLAFVLGSAIGAAGDGSPDAKNTAAARPRPATTITTTATATATETAKAEPAPTVTETRTVKVRVTVTPNPAAAGGDTSDDSGADTASGTCSITSNSGNCYSAGQFCRSVDHGASTTTASGSAITCRYSSNAWRWSYS